MAQELTSVDKLTRAQKKLVIKILSWYTSCLHMNHFSKGKCGESLAKLIERLKNALMKEDNYEKRMYIVSDATSQVCTHYPNDTHMALTAILETHYEYEKQYCAILRQLKEDHLFHPAILPATVEAATAGAAVVS